MLSLKNPTIVLFGHAFSVQPYPMLCLHWDWHSVAAATYSNKLNGHTNCTSTVGSVAYSKVTSVVKKCGSHRNVFLTVLMQRNRLKVEEKELDFIFEVANVQFNQLGKYILVLTVENPLKNESGTGLKLRINDGDVLQSSSGHTDAILQTNLDEFCTCMCKTFVFTLPKGRLI